MSNDTEFTQILAEKIQLANTIPYDDNSYVHSGNDEVARPLCKYPLIGGRPVICLTTLMPKQYFSTKFANNNEQASLPLKVTDTNPIVAFNIDLQLYPSSVTFQLLPAVL